MQRTIRQQESNKVTKCRSLVLFLLLLLMNWDVWSQCSTVVSIDPPVGTIATSLGSMDAKNQSFLMTSAGRISDITFHAGNVVYASGGFSYRNRTVILRIRQSDSQSGTILYQSEPHTFSWPGEFGYSTHFTINIPSEDSPDLEAGQLYNFEIAPVDAEVAFKLGNTNGYPDGSYEGSTTLDMDFTIRMYSNVPTIPVISGDADFCEETIILTATADAGNSFVWYQDGTEIVGETSSTLEVAEGGTYSVFVSDASSCNSLSTDFVVNDRPIETAIVNATDYYDWSANGVTYLYSDFVEFYDDEVSACDTLRHLDLTINKTPINDACGNILSFDGVDDYVKADSVNFTNDEFTIEYYFKGSNGQSAVRIQNGGTYLATGYLNNRHILSWDGAGTGISSGNMSDGDWHHVAVTWKRNTTNGFVSYLDGILIAQRNSNDAAIPDLSKIDVILGSYNGTSEFLNGSLDEVRIWNKALTQEELRAVIDNGVTGAEPDLLRYYNFNSGYGDKLRDQVSSGDGYLYNMDNSSWTLEDGSPGGNTGSLDVVSADTAFYWPVSGDSLYYTGQYEFVTQSPGDCDTLKLLDISINQSPKNSVCGNVLNFDGVNEYVKADPIGFANDELTVAYYFKGSNGQYSVHIQNGGNYMVGAYQNSKHILSWDGGVNGLSAGALADGKWHHVAFTWKRNSYNGFVSYLDGSVVEQRTSTDAAIPDFSAIDLFLGSFQGSSQFINGSMDDLHIWNRALSRAELREVIENGTLGSEQDLLVSYDFNTGYGSSLIDAVSGNNGVLFNMDDTNWTLEDGTSGGHIRQIEEVAAEDYYIWPLTGDSLLYSGQYEFITSTDDGCDVLNVLNLAINHSPLNDACGNVLNFDGVDDYALADPISFTQDELTIEYYFKGSSSRSAVRIDDGTSYIRMADQDHGHVLSWDGPSDIGMGALSDGVWHHVALTWKRNTVDGFVSYLDGEVIDQRTSVDVAIPDFSAMDLYLGSYGGTTAFTYGALDDVRIWNRALTQEELLYHLKNCVDTTDPDLLVFYDFNEGYGDLLNDLSIGNNGQLMNMNAVDWTLESGEVGGNTGSSQLIAAIDSFFWDQTGLTYRFSGAYDAVISSSTGCDSTLVLDLIINHSPINDVCGNSISMNNKTDVIQGIAPSISTDEFTIELYYQGTGSPILAIGDQLLIDGTCDLAWEPGTLDIESKIDEDWHYHAVTWKRNDAKGFTSYYDGIVVAEQASVDLPLPALGGLDLLIGAHAAGTGSGSYDEIRIWEKALSQEEIQANILNGVQGDEPGLLSYYSFDEGVGSGSVDLSGTNDLNFVNMDNSSWMAPNGVSPSSKYLDTTMVVYLGTDSIFFDDQYLFLAGSYTDTISSFYGCDSLVYLTIENKLPGGLSSAGQQLMGVSDGDSFGYKVSINDDGTFLAIGARNADGARVSAGTVTFFENIGGTWTEFGSAIEEPELYAGVQADMKLSGDGQILVVGSESYDGSSGGYDRGNVRVFKKTEDDFLEIFSLEGLEQSNALGEVLSINADGSVFAASEKLYPDGIIRVFERESGTDNYLQKGSTLFGGSGTTSLGYYMQMNNTGDRLVTLADWGDAIITYDYQVDDWIALDTISADGNDFFSLSGSGNRMLIFSYSYNPASDDYESYVELMEFDGANWNAVAGVFPEGSVQDYAMALNEAGDEITVIMEEYVNSNWVYKMKRYGEVGGELIPLGEELVVHAPSEIDLSSNGEYLAVGCSSPDDITLEAGIVSVYKISNTEPVISTTINDQLLDPGFSTLAFDLTTIFSESDAEQQLTYSVTSSKDDAITTSLYGSNLTFREVTPGYTDIELSANDRNGGQASLAFRISVGNVWDGASWTSGSAPSGVSNAAISEDYTFSIDGGLETNDLFVSAGVKLTIDNEQSLVVNGDFDNEGVVIVESGSSLLTFGSISGNDFTIKRITTFDQSTGRYSIVGSPIVDASFDVLGAGALVYGYDETQAYNPAGNEGLDRFKTPAQLSQTIMQPGQGYFSAFTGDESGQVSFIGMPNTGIINVSLSYTDQGSAEEEDFEGFNLVSNPYPAAISANDLLDANSSAIDQTIYLWDDSGSENGRGSNADYLMVNRTLGATNAPAAGGVSKWDGYLRSGQGFFVKTSAPGTLTFTDALKNMANSNADGGFFRLAPITRYKLLLSNKDVSKSTILGFIEDATTTHDGAYDAIAMSGAGLSIFTREPGSNRKLAIQGLPAAFREEIILGFQVSEPGMYSLSLANLEEVISGCYLLDTYTQKKINLTKGYYSFTSQAGTYEDRFRILSPEIITGLDDLQEINMSGKDGYLHLLSDQPIKAGSEYQLIDLMGKEVISGTIKLDSKHVEIPVGTLPKAVYVLHLNQQGKRWSGKIILE